MDETIEKEMNLLLNNFWITKDYEKEEYYLLKRNQNKIRDFVSKNLGTKLLVHDRFIKLEKIPAKPSPTFGIPSFLSSFDYVLLFLCLLFLEDKPRGEKFILSRLIEYLKHTAITLELSNVPDWNLRSHRTSLSRVVNFLLEEHVLLLKDKDNFSFEENQEADALYEVTGLSNYLIPSFDYDIYNCTTATDFLEKEWGEETREKGDIRRYKVYRHLLYTPAISRKDLTDSEDDYIRKMHKTIEKEIQDNLKMGTEITRNLALLYADDNILQKEYFPNTKKVSDVVLLLNKEIVSFVQKEQLELDREECYYLTKVDFKRILTNVREEKKEYFSKGILDLSNEKYVRLILEFMENFHLLKEEEDRIIVYPVINRFVGKTFENKEKENIEQINIEEVVGNAL